MMLIGIALLVAVLVGCVLALALVVYEAEQDARSGDSGLAIFDEEDQPES